MTTSSSEVPAEEAEIQERVAEKKYLRVMAWFKAIGQFLKATANALTKAAICLGTLGVHVAYESKLPAWSVVVIIICVYGFDLARNIRIKSSWISIDFNSASSKADADEMPTTDKKE